MTLSSEEVDRIIMSTAEVFSQPSQADMLNFFMEMREKQRKARTRLMTIPEKWFQTEIVRRVFREERAVDPNENKTEGYDFEVDRIGIELKTSGSFTYQGASNRLLNEIRSGRKKPGCWMFIAVYDEGKEAEMRRELSRLNCGFKMEKIRNTRPEWCVVLIWRRNEVKVIV